MRKTDLWTPSNQPQFSRRNLLLGGVGLGAIGLLAACGSDTNSSNGAADSESGALTSLTAGVLPIVDVAAIYIASTQGIFQNHGLDIDMTLAQGGAAVVPGVVAGDFMFGFSNLTSLLIARSRGLNLKTVAPGSGSNGQVGADYFGVFVAGDSDIQNGADLSGHTIAVNTVQNINDSTIKAALEDAGGDPDSVTFMEIGFPDMPAALENGQVDAIAVAEPFLTQVIDNGGRDVLSAYARPVDNLTVSAYFTSDDLWNENPDTVTAFQEAMAQAQQIAREDEQAVREVLPSYTGIEPELAERIILPSFPEKINAESTQVLADLAEEGGFLEGDLNVSDLLGEGSH
ncbi:MAG TPA: ABC transporter substrate-binding protein [Enteractinococcus helveticum]|uniref:ABC transporter substrate-binding protein n=1 Tax=Enteractinococcus helveticum TaxID=1837282 RepID=A0A921K8E6_9MICC|nr:ABC transporter substrate-binding protein [Enteractinococcus helveticum]HJF15905.1 ABC transporter substrate-binding protein [Enteractinococcus helveticum]